MNKEELKERTKKFSHRCVKLATVLPRNTLGKIVAGQLIRASTSVAANYRAACLAHSNKAFASKISIVIEEADETEFWIEFVIDEKLISKPLVESLLKEAHELTSIFISSRRTAQSRMN